MKTAIGSIACNAGMRRGAGSHPCSNADQVTIHTAKGCSLMMVDASPYHYWSIVILVMLSERRTCIALSLMTPNEHFAVVIRQIEVSFIFWYFIWSLYISPTWMDPRPDKTTWTVRLSGQPKSESWTSSEVSVSFVSLIWINLTQK